jgi:hypothetical protein
MLRSTIFTMVGRLFIVDVEGSQTSMRHFETITFAQESAPWTAGVSGAALCRRIRQRSVQESFETQAWYPARCQSIRAGAATVRLIAWQAPRLFATRHRIRNISILRREITILAVRRSRRADLVQRRISAITATRVTRIARVRHNQI